MPMCPARASNDGGEDMRGRGQHEHPDPKRLQYTTGQTAPTGAIPDPLDEIERTLLAYAAKATEFAELDPGRYEWFRARQAAFMDSIAVVQSVRRAHKVVIRRSQEAPPGTVF
jgi:hypothetical protein